MGGSGGRPSTTTAALGQAEVPDELAPIGRLHAHHPGDRSRAVRGGCPGPGRGGAARRVRLGGPPRRTPVVPCRCSSFDPRPRAAASVERSSSGSCLSRARPPACATAIDSLQPISAALYAQYGSRPAAAGPEPGRHDPPSRRLPPLPSGIVAVPFETIAGGPPDGPGHRRLTEVVAPARSRAARRRAPGGPPLPARRRRGAASCTAAPDGTAVWATATRAEVGRGGMPVAVLADSESARGTMRGPPARRRSGAAGRRCRDLGHRRPPTGRAARRRWRRGCGSRSSRSCCAGTGRLADFTRYLPISPGLL